MDCQSVNQRGPVRIGLVGLGRAGRGIAPAIARSPNARLSAVVDLHRESVMEFQQTYGAEAFASIEDLCRGDAIDAVYVATPTQFHTAHVMTAAEHGKHVIVEKPMALSLADADGMIAAAERNGVNLIVTHSNGYAPPIRKIREIVRSGELGAVKMINNWYYTDWLYRPRMKEELDTAQGGGVTLRQGSHQFDIIRMIGGGLVRSVRAMTGVWDASRPTEGSHTAFLDFADGPVATAVYSGYDRFHSAALTFGIGEGGRIVNEPYAAARRKVQSPEKVDEAALKRARGKAPVAGSASEKHQQFFGLTIVSCEKGDIRQSPDGLYIYGDDALREVPIGEEESGRDWAIRELCGAVIDGRAPLHSGRWGKANLEVCLAVLESARTRREVMLSHQIAVAD